jgi:transcriptional regulator with XRE-family HTH domain
MKEFGITERSAYNIKNGSTELTVSRIKRIAEITGKSVDYLLSEGGDAA